MALKGYGTPVEIAKLCGYDYDDDNVMQGVTDALEVIEEEVDQYCNTTFVAEDATSKYFSGDGSENLSLGFYIRTLDSVEIVDSDGNVLETLTDVAMQPSSPRSGAYIYLERTPSFSAYGTYTNVFPVGLNNIKVTGDWGLAEIPASIKHAVALSVRHFFNLRNYDATKVSELGVQRNIEFIRGDRITYLHPASMKILDKWRNSRHFSQ